MFTSADKDVLYFGEVLVAKIFPWFVFKELLRSFYGAGQPQKLPVNLRIFVCNGPFEHSIFCGLEFSCPQEYFNTKIILVKDNSFETS